MERGPYYSPLLYWNTEMINEAIIRNKLQEFFEIEFYIVDIQISPKMKIEILADNIKGITIGECKKIHKFLISEFGEELDDYIIEVSSPGLTKNLKVWQQYNKVKGQEIIIRTKENEEIRAIVLEADENKVKIKTTTEEKEFSYNEIKKAKLILNF